MLHTRFPSKRQWAGAISGCGQSPLAAERCSRGAIRLPSSASRTKGRARLIATAIRLFRSPCPSVALAGVQAPAHHAVALMVPGSPSSRPIGPAILDCWRRPASMRNQDLVDVPALRRAGGASRRSACASSRPVLACCASPWNQLVSALPAFFVSGGRETALLWMGHEPKQKRIHRRCCVWKEPAPVTIPKAFDGLRACRPGNELRRYFWACPASSWRRNCAPDTPSGRYRDHAMNGWNSPYSSRSLPSTASILQRDSSSPRQRAPKDKPPLSASISLRRIAHPPAASALTGKMRSRFPGLDADSKATSIC